MFPNSVSRTQFRFLIDGDTSNAGDTVGGRLYIDGNQIAASAGLDNTFTSEWIGGLSAGPHQMLWIEGPSVGAANTAPTFNAEQRTTQHVRIIDKANGQSVPVTQIVDASNVVINRVAGDQLSLGDCDEASGEKAASVVKQCADVGKNVIVFGPELLTNGDFSLSSGIGPTSTSGPGWTTAYTVGNPTPGASQYAVFNTNAARAFPAGPAANIPALTGRSMVVNVGPNVALAIIQWENVYLTKGKTYTLEADTAIVFDPFSIRIGINDATVAVMTAPVATGV